MNSFSSQKIEDFALSYNTGGEIAELVQSLN